MLNKDFEKYGILLSGNSFDGLFAKIFSYSKEKFYIGGFCVLCDKESIILCYVLNIELSFPNNYDYFLNDKEKELLVLIHDESLSYIINLKPLFIIKNNIVYKANKTISHESYVSSINKETLDLICNDFSKNDIYGSIGKFFGTDIDATIPLKLFFRRSNGIFGKTGTGKTFISRILISYAMHNNIASFLIFDMHGEYAHSVTSENKIEKTPGLKELFPNDILLVNISNESSNNKQYDLCLKLPINIITIDDILSLQKELALHPTACEAAYLLYIKYNKDWLITLINKENDLLQLSKEIGAHPESISALHRKIKRICNLPFISKDNDSENISIKLILNALEIGKSIIIQFENINDSLSYLLVSTIFTRIALKRLSKKVSINDKSCIIVIEEAHKFLHPSVSNQTPFGMIAREMRKYGMSLLIIDQRPSQIDTEVLSQISTKFLLNLSDESDKLAVLSGSENINYLKKLFESISFNKNMIITGHSVPFSYLVEIITYNKEFCKKFEAKHLQVNEYDIY